MVNKMSRRTLVIAIPVLFAATAPAYLRAYMLSGISDAPTLLLGDTAVVNQAAYWVTFPYPQIRLFQIAQPKRGDLVQVLRPDRPLLVFKRVMALPGEAIEIRDNQVLIDNKPLPVHQLAKSDFLWVTEPHHIGGNVYDEGGHWVAFTPGVGESRNFGPIKLNSDEYFLLGDNRDVRLDCRSWGPLKETAIRGKVVVTRPTGLRRK